MFITSENIMTKVRQTHSYCGKMNRLKAISKKINHMLPVRSFL